MCVCFLSLSSSPPYYDYSAYVSFFSDSPSASSSEALLPLITLRYCPFVLLFAFFFGPDSSSCNACRYRISIYRTIFCRLLLVLIGLHHCCHCCYLQLLFSLSSSSSSSAFSSEYSLFDFLLCILSHHLLAQIVSTRPNAKPPNSTMDLFVNTLATCPAAHSNTKLHVFQ